MRGKAIGSPNALDGGERQPHGPGHRPTGPMCDFSRRFGAGQRQHLGDSRSPNGRPAGRSRFVPQPPVDASFSLAPLPAPHRRTTAARAGGNGEHRQQLGRDKNNPSALNVLQRPATVANDRGQARAILGRNNHGDSLGLGLRIPQYRAVVNPARVSVH
jgi:hypothetical protein